MPGTSAALNVSGASLVEQEENITYSFTSEGWSSNTAVGSRGIIASFLPLPLPAPLGGFHQHRVGLTQPYSLLPPQSSLPCGSNSSNTITINNNNNSSST